MGIGIKAVLKNIAISVIREQCEKDAERVYQIKMVPAAQNGEFSATISSEEMNELRESAYRSLLIKILEERGLKITEAHDRDEYFITISWQ